MDNAVKFRNGGDSVLVSVSTDSHRTEAVLSVKDKGIGIEADLFPRLFDVFGQADVSLDRSRGGLGVGLSVVRGLVELHGGDIEVLSPGRGQGATFTIRLPLKREPPALQPTAQFPVRSNKAVRVLIIEDQRDAAESLRILLELLGHHVLVAYTGTEGVRVAHEWRPEVVLCDIGLPGMDGYGVAGELRRDPTTAGAQLIAISGYGEDVDRRRSEQAGFDHHLTKPVDPAILQPMLVRTA
jgi:CheY-like chemotaxis protein